MSSLNYLLSFDHGYTIYIVVTRDHRLHVLSFQKSHGNSFSVWADWEVNTVFLTDCDYT